MVHTILGALCNLVYHVKHYGTLWFALYLVRYVFWCITWYAEVQTKFHYGTLWSTMVHTKFTPRNLVYHVIHYGSHCTWCAMFSGASRDTLRFTLNLDESRLQRTRTHQSWDELKGVTSLAFSYLIMNRFDLDKGVKPAIRASLLQGHVANAARTFALFDHCQRSAPFKFSPTVSFAAGPHRQCCKSTFSLFVFCQISTSFEFSPTMSFAAGPHHHCCKSTFSLFVFCQISASFKFPPTMAIAAGLRSQCCKSTFSSLSLITARYRPHFIPPVRCLLLVHAANAAGAVCLTWLCALYQQGVLCCWATAIAASAAYYQADALAGKILVGLLCCLRIWVAVNKK